jgi:hypothetical protein
MKLRTGVLLLLLCHCHIVIMVLGIGRQSVVVGGGIVLTVSPGGTSISDDRM